MAARPGRGVTLGDVAREAKVSTTAASFVLSGRSGSASSGSPQTRAAVLAAAEKLGYVPNRHARAIRTGRSDLVTLSLGPVGDPWLTSMAEAVQQRVHPQGFSTILMGDDNWFEFLSGYASAASLISMPARDLGDMDQVRRLAHSGHQMVVYGPGNEPEGFDVIATDPLTIIGDALADLRSRHDRVALFTPHLPGQTPWRSRADAFLDAGLARGEDPACIPIVQAAAGRRQSFEIAVEWLRGPDRPTAVIGSTAHLAVAVQAAAQRVGLTLPADLELVAIGDVPRDALLADEISYWGVRDVFARTADLVARRAQEGPDRPPARHTFDWEFFAGTTTR